MTEKLVPAEPELIDCEICLKEIPEAAAMTEEGKDYVLHFCGLECYAAWKQKQGKAPEKDR